MDKVERIIIKSAQEHGARKIFEKELLHQLSQIAARMRSRPTMVTETMWRHVFTAVGQLERMGQPAGAYGKTIQKIARVAIELLRDGNSRDDRRLVGLAVRISKLINW